MDVFDKPEVKKSAPGMYYGPFQLAYFGPNTRILTHLPATQINVTLGCSSSSCIDAQVNKGAMSDTMGLTTANRAIVTQKWQGVYVHINYIPDADSLQ